MYNLSIRVLTSFIFVIAVATAGMSQSFSLPKGPKFKAIPGWTASYSIREQAFTEVQLKNKDGDRATINWLKSGSDLEAGLISTMKTWKSHRPKQYREWEYTKCKIQRCNYVNKNQNGSYAPDMFTARVQYSGGSIAIHLSLPHRKDVEATERGDKFVELIIGATL